MRKLFALGVVSAHLMVQPVHAADKFIDRPRDEIQGCDIFVDPAGNEKPSHQCLKSLCRAFPPRIVDGKKVCTFTCTQRFDD